MQLDGHFETGAQVCGAQPRMYTQSLPKVMVQPDNPAQLAVSDDADQAC